MKIALSNNEANLLEMIARKTGCGWFTIDEDNHAVDLTGDTSSQRLAVKYLIEAASVGEILETLNSKESVILIELLTKLI